MSIPARPVLLTGASGALGRVLARELATLGWTLRLTDIAPFPDPVPAGASFDQVDLADGPGLMRLAEGCGTIAHFGGVSMEEPFETVLEPNIRGVYHAFEASRRQGARMVYASSHHVAGFYRRTESVSAADPVRPDGYYGLSKAYGELMARLYWDKHGLSSVLLRLGVSRPVPTEARMLASWLSHADMTSLVVRSALAEVRGVKVVWGVSNNAAMTWWRDDDRADIGWSPRDTVDGYGDALRERVSDDPVAEAFQGGPFCAKGYDRVG